jgi:hypothetical protein
MTQITIAADDPVDQYAVGSTPTTGPWTISYPYFSEDDILVYKDGVLQTITTHYTISGTAVDDGFSGGAVTWATSISSCTLTLERAVPIARTSDFPTAGIFNIATLNTTLDKIFAICQQVNSKILRAIKRPSTSTETYSLDWPDGFDATERTIKITTTGGIEVGPAVTDIGAAGTNATAAAASAAAAAASETAAGVSETNAAASYDAFDDRYLGSKSSAPSLDNDGDALLDGALYWNTTDNNMYVYDLGGTAWVTVSNSATSIAAAASASAASTSETNAGTSESAASTSASNASTSASNAATAKTAAEAAQAAAEAALDEFTDTYLGAKATDPTVDNDGDALTTGDQYFNTGSNVLKIWNGSSWQAAALSANDFVSKTSGTGSAGIPVGTTGQRDGSPATGYFRYNSTENQFEGYDGSAWGQIGGGAGYFKGDNGTVGSSAGDIFRINEAELNANVTIAATENASATGPVGVASGVTLTVDGVLVII